MKNRVGRYAFIIFALAAKLIIPGSPFNTRGAAAVATAKAIAPFLFHQILLTTVIVIKALTKSIIFIPSNITKLFSLKLLIYLDLNKHYIYYAKQIPTYFNLQ